MIRISIKKQILYLSYLFFVLTFLSMSFEIALKSGAASSLGGLFMPVMNSFYWPRFAIFLLPSIVLIFFVSINKKQYERILKGLFLMAAPIVASVSFSLFSSYQIITPFDQPEQFTQLYYVTLFSKFVIMLGITLLGMIWTFQNDPKISNDRTLD